MRKTAFAWTVLLLLLPIARAGADLLQVRPSREARGHLDIRAEDASLAALLALLELRLDRAVTLKLPRDPQVTYHATSVGPERALRELVRAAGLVLEETAGAWVVRVANEPAVTMDVMDTDLKEIVGSLAEQCGIRNVMIWPGVSGRGTFRFTDVPCSTALEVAFRSLGVVGNLEPNSVLVVKRP